MLLADSDVSIEIDPVGTIPQQNAHTPGDPCVRVKVRTKNFEGVNHAVCVPRPTYDAFVESLVALERQRTGDATLSSADPAELGVRLRAIDSAGHIVVEGFVGERVRPQSGRLLESKITFQIAIDPSTLPQLVKEFKTLAERH